MRPGKTNIMRLKLNGEDEEVQATNVAELMDELKAPPTGIAIALNGSVVRRAQHSSTPLRDGDEIEIIRAVQGG